MAKPSVQTEHEIRCLAQADHFIATRGRATTRTSERFDTMELALDFATTCGDGRTMIYAVTADGNSAHIRNA